VHDVEHFGYAFARVITNIYAGGKGSLAGAFNYYNINRAVCCAGRQRGIEVPE
jgi:hypothetical protein